MYLKESLFVCPICKNKLFKISNSYKCLKGHCFDIAKEGYINLLMNNSHGKRHGDDLLMVKSRTSFLNQGYYLPLRDNLTEFIGVNKIIIDAGCGEGYYTKVFSENNKVIGVDISKVAISEACKNCPKGEFAVASVSSLPIKDNFADCVVNVFAPDSNNEYLRTLKKNGTLIMVYPMENHLLNLKKSIYNNAYTNPSPVLMREGFSINKTKELKYTITLKNDQNKIKELNYLKTQVEFLIVEYIKK